jgi:hypothetical protein
VYRPGGVLGDAADSEAVDYRDLESCDDNEAVTKTEVRREVKVVTS